MQNFNVLAIDTVTDLCSVAYKVGDQISYEETLEPKGHSKKILGMIDKVIQSAKLEANSVDVIAYDSGPGSFTGIRIGAGVAQGLALGLGKPLIAISSLMILAESAKSNHNDASKIFAAIDARMNQVYWGCLEYCQSAYGGWRWITQPEVCFPSEISIPTEDFVGIGSGWDLYSEVFSPQDRVEWQKNVLPSAKFVAQIAERILSSKSSGVFDEIMPTYVRNKVTG